MTWRDDLDRAFENLQRKHESDWATEQFDSLSDFIERLVSLVESLSVEEVTYITMGLCFKKQVSCKVPMSELKEFLLREVEFGDDNTYLTDDENSWLITICHETDLHFGGDKKFTDLAKQAFGKQ